MSWTDEDADKAREIVEATAYRGRMMLTKAIAEALATEREKARAPFLELADHYLSEARKRGLPSGGDLAMVSSAIRSIAERQP